MDGGNGAARPIYKGIVAGVRPPPMDAAIREELAAFVRPPQGEGGALDGFLSSPNALISPRFEMGSFTVCLS